MSTGCARAKTPNAAAVDREPTAALLEWLRGHEPSRLDISGVSMEPVRSADGDAFLRIVSGDPRTACRRAASDRALLLIYAPLAQPVRRAAALDCGFALWRDERAVIVAPR